MKNERHLLRRRLSQVPSLIFDVPSQKMEDSLLEPSLDVVIPGVVLGCDRRADRAARPAILVLAYLISRGWLIGIVPIVSNDHASYWVLVVAR